MPVEDLAALAADELLLSTRAQVDLRFTSILTDLGLPLLDQNEAYSDALMTAMMYLKLRDLEARDVKIVRQRTRPVSSYGGG